MTGNYELVSSRENLWELLYSFPDTDTLYLQQTKVHPVKQNKVYPVKQTKVHPVKQTKVHPVKQGKKSIIGSGSN